MDREYIFDEIAILEREGIHRERYYESVAELDSNTSEQYQA
jgi:hypothetical protein